MLADLAVASTVARELIESSPRGREILATAPPGRREAARQRLERRTEQVEELLPDAP